MMFFALSDNESFLQGRDGVAGSSLGNGGNLFEVPSFLCCSATAVPHTHTKGEYAFNVVAIEGQ